MVRAQVGSRPECAALDPDHIRLRDLLTQDQALKGLCGLSEEGELFAGVFAFEGIQIVPVGVVHGKDTPDVSVDDIRSLLEEVRDTGKETVSPVSGGRVAIACPIRLRCDDRALLKGCFALLTSETSPSGANGWRHLAGFVADLCSERISTVFASRAEDTGPAESQVARYKRFVDMSDDFMMVCDDRGAVVAANHKVISELGYAREDMIGRNSATLYPEPEAEKARAAAHRARATGMTIESIHLLRSDGSLVPTQVFVAFDTDRRLYELVFRDLSKRLRMEKEIRERSEELQAQYEKTRAAMEERDRFFRSVSHELRTPLTSVIGFAELVLEDTADPLNDEQRLALERIAGNAHKLLALVNDLLDLSKLEAHGMHLDLTRVRLDELLEQIAHNMMPLVTDKSISLSVEVSPDVPVMTTDEQKLGQIMVNLVANAIKFTRQGSISMIATRNGGTVSIAVKDTGVGIPSEEIDELFKEFRQGTRNGRGQRGTGLGLSIARRLALFLGGNITVESEVDVGSTFTVELPIVAREERPVTGT